MNRFFFIILVCVTILTTKTYAQKKEEIDNNDSWTILFSTEFPFLKSKDFNKILNSNGLQNANDIIAVPGIEFRTNTDNLIFSISYNGLSTDKIYNSEIVKSKYSSFALNFGPNLSKSYNTSFYPYLGLKNFNYNYQNIEKIEDNELLNNYLNNNVSYKEINKFNLNLDFGMGISYQLLMISLSAKTGLQIPIMTRTTINNQYISKENISTKSIFYIALSIGLGENSQTRRISEVRRNKYLTTK